MPANATSQKARHKTDKVDASQEDAIQRRGLCSKEGQTKREDRAHGTMPLEQVYTQQCVQSAQAAYRLHPFGAVCDKPAAESKAIVVGGKKNRVTKGHEKSQKGTNKRAKWKDLALDSTKLRPGLKQRSQSTAKYQRPMTITASMFP